jgi:predicted DCC family thiol-disulfide oxidoreductase YuxK
LFDGGECIYCHNRTNNVCSHDDEKQVSVFTVTIKEITSFLMTEEKQVSVFTDIV